LNIVLLRFYFILYYCAIIKALNVHPTLLGRLILKLFLLIKLIIISSINLIRYILKFILLILVKIESRGYFMPLNLKLFVVYIYFVFIRYNIIWKFFLWINIKVFHFLTLFFICTLFLDHMSVMYIYKILNLTFMILHSYTNNFINLEYYLPKVFYYYIENYFFKIYEQNNIFINIGFYDRDIVEFIREAYERTLTYGF
jgi:hypothetical protein